MVTCGSDNPDDLIADFMMDNGIHPADGRSGGFYVYGDTKGAFDPPKNPDETVAYPIDMTTGNMACSGAGSFRVKGMGFSEWGAAAGTDFEPSTVNMATSTKVKGTYDATKYKGISFFIKASAPLKYVQVKFPDVNTDDQADPSMLPDPSMPGMMRAACALTPNFTDFNCSPYLVKLGDTDDTDFPAYKDVKIDTNWQKLSIMFADTKQDRYNAGKNPFGALDVAHLTAFAVQVNANFTTMPASANDFEIWLDDIRFIR